MGAVSRRTRWGRDPRLDARGRPVPIIFTENDLELCKLLAFSANVRRPWSYEYLTTSYIELLLSRGHKGIQARLRDLSSIPNDYICKPDQPDYNARELIYALAPKGAEEIRELGQVVPRLAKHNLSHQLMACIIGASFEYATIKDPAVAIGFDFKVPDFNFYPDWPTFRLTTPAQSQIVLIEADRSTEQLDGSQEATTIAGKFEQYLSLLEKGLLRKAKVVFVTTRRTRVDAMIELLKKVIDRQNFPHDYAGDFLFTNLDYSRFLTKVPKLSDWAVSQGYLRAGLGPFHFLKPGR